jgi:hypothetical protein
VILAGPSRTFARPVALIGARHLGALPCEEKGFRKKLQGATMSWITFAAFLGWLLAIGALGAIAFILVNALGIQADPTVDVTNRDATWFRVLLGALFSVILTLPFGYPSFTQVLRIDAKHAVLLLMPFLFGFSTFGT